MQRNRVISIDIGSDTIKIVLGSKTGQDLEVLESAIVPVQGVVCGVVTDVEKCTQSLRKALQRVKAKETDFLVVGIGNYYIESTKSIQSKYIAENEKIKEEDLDDLLDKAENAYLKEELEYLDVFLQHYHVDSMREIHNPVGMRGVKLEASYTLFSYRKTLIANIEQCINDAGFKVGEFLFAPYYGSEVLFSVEDTESSVLLIDLGADNTRASIFVDGALYSSFAVPFGSRSITLDIKNSYPVTLKQAEALKRQFSCALAECAEENAEVGFKSSDAWGERSLRVSELAGVVQCRLDEIFHGIRYQLRKMAQDNRVENIILVGGGVAQNSMKEYMERKFDVAVKFGDIQVDKLKGVEELPARLFASALGMLYFELNTRQQDTVHENTGLLGRLKQSWGGFFGKKSSGKDIKM